jgi:hypothetical protein
MVKLGLYRGGAWLRAADLGSKEHTVQVEAIREEEVGADGQRKLVARFAGKSKGLVLNDANLETLEAAFGADSSDAVGGQVILFVDPDVRYAGRKVGGIRIRLPAAKRVTKEKAAAKSPTAEYLNDELPDDESSEW